MTDTNIAPPEVVDIPGLRAELAELRQRLADAQRAVAWHTQDLERIAEAIREEAQNREWCTEYGEFVDRMNDRTHGTWLEHCVSSTDVTYRVRVEGSGRPDDMSGFAERICNVLSDALDDEDNVERREHRLLMAECPAGGPHTWTDAVDVQYDDPRSRSYLPPAERWHCDECGAPMPREEHDD